MRYGIHEVKHNGDKILVAFNRKHEKRNNRKRSYISGPVMNRRESRTIKHTEKRRKEKKRKRYKKKKQRRKKITSYPIQRKEVSIPQ
jgi:hypothetical protein